MKAAALSTPFCAITDEALSCIVQGQGAYFSPLMGIPAEKFAADTLDPRKAEDMAALLEDFVSLRGKRVLEIGAGCGVTHIVWSRKFGIDGWGVEPDGAGFDTSASVARDLVRANGLDPDRILNARGEALPFADASFDVVYSSNVLEHVDDPAQVLREAVRVLKPGGLLQIVCPNYHSYFDGHYGAFHPPVFSKLFFIWWLKWVYRKDTVFAASLRTEVNARWVRRQLVQIGDAVPLQIHTLGEAIFLKRLQSPSLPQWGSMGKAVAWAKLARRFGLSGLLGRIIVGLQGWTPLIITVSKKA